MVLYAASGQVFAVNCDGGGRRQLTQIPEGIREALLAGYGRVAYASTDDGRLLRIDVGRGAAEVIIPRTPAISGRFGGEAPGSLHWIRTSGLPPTPDGIEVRIAQSLAPLV